MPPRKRPKSSASKSIKQSSSNHSSQPSNFDIQQLFLRHIQKSQSTSNSHTSKSDTVVQNVNGLASDTSVLTPQNPVSTWNERPDESKDMDQQQLTEASPEIFKNPKRFKFSPGMLIKQSQDDGGEEITWKISPVKERLRAAVKQIPKMMELTEKSVGIKSSTIRPCSLDKTQCPTSGITSKAEQWLSSPSKKVSKRPAFAADWVMERVKPSADGELEIVNTSTSGNSPFQTPPSLSCPHKKLPCSVTCSGACGLTGAGQHKKALLELLDQVEDVIPVDDKTADHVGTVIPQLQVEDDSICSVVDYVIDEGPKTLRRKQSSKSR